ncbi:MAG: MoaD/ThiS family protein [Chloroflexi bacterium]|nr:MoaD/ThiS family protein [Chloroflexota bacterium]MDA8187974.1 MoaD/ThiS family protein [Dehalococcoidales bacterium]
MPRVRLKYLAPICDITGKWEEEATVAEGTTLAEVMGQRAGTYGAEYRKLFFDATGTFKPMFIVLRNDQPTDDFAAPVCDGDRFTFVPPIAGG